jgi:dTMP kinase
MEIIAFEGLDKCGKCTQTKLLFERMANLAMNIVKSEFHRYDTPTGRLVRQFLYNEYDVDQYTIELIIAADKQAQMKWFRKLMEQEVKFLILDRYTSSQEAYAHSNGMSQSWIKLLANYLMKPSLEIFIDIPVDESMSRKGKMPTDDKYEKNKDLLQTVRDKYTLMFSADIFDQPNRFIVDGMQSIEKVHEDIWCIVKSFYKF